MQTTFKHPSFKPKFKYFDIALIKLKHDAPLAYHIWPACLVSETDAKKGVKFTIAGFGRDDIKNGETIKSVELLII